MNKFLSLGFAAAFSVLSMTAIVAPAHAFDYTLDDDGGEEDASDFAYEMAAGGYQEMMEGYEDGEFNRPFDEVEFDDEDEDEDEDE
jgi:hypothetical protein